MASSKKKTESAGEANLPADIFAVTGYSDLVQMTVRWQSAKHRAGTHSTLGRSDMKGGGKKPFGQKKTGNARAGTNISPLWRGGAIVFGPKPRCYEFRHNKTARGLALRAALSDRASTGDVVVMATAGAPKKTQDAVKLLESIGMDMSKKALLVLSDAEYQASGKMFKNIENLAVVNVAGVSVRGVVGNSKLILTKDSLNSLSSNLTGAAE
jgi:large subunit ribosomal protein L4